MRAYTEFFQTLYDDIQSVVDRLKESGVVFSDAATEINEDFISKRETRRVQWEQADRPAKFCMLSLNIRLRDGRPTFRWLRRKRKNGKQTFSSEVRPQNLASLTTELDHDLVMGAEKELLHLRNLAKWLVKAHYRLEATVRHLEKTGIVTRYQESADEFPLMGEEAERAKAERAKAKRKPKVPVPSPSPEQLALDIPLTKARKRSKLVPPSQMPTFKERYD